ncbi:MAG: sulfotransferase domain-containing protein [Ectothiorhodospiraceae bacterium]|nr:sulfotransferase domain-containing protein [Chromatiales bacterium]MCP5155954.1 sulfotransferase domain-containing protein [Ectothiorhodospiraceae bacterium]
MSSTRSARPAPSAVDIGDPTDFPGAARLLGARLGLRELADGFALAYPRGEAWRQRLDVFTARWERLVPGFDFRVVDNPAEETLSLRISGSPAHRDRLGDLLSRPSATALRGALWKWRAHIASRVATCLARVLPDFLIIGAPKCGTDALFSYLGLHPAVRPGLWKEMHFFTETFERGVWAYRAKFPTMAERRAVRARHGGFATGEATPIYLVDPRVPMRVAATLPHARFVAILRNPVDRTYSQYQADRRAGRVTDSFEAVLDEEMRRIDTWRADYRSAPDGTGFLRRGSWAVAGSLYADQLEDWYRHVPAERIHVVLGEDLRADHARVYREVESFLGLPAAPVPVPGSFNQYPYAPMVSATRERLLEFFRLPNERLAALLGRSLPWTR